MKNIVGVTILVAVCCNLYMAIAFAEPNTLGNEPNRAGANNAQVSSEVKKTQVVIVGTIHSGHHFNPKYSPDILKQIILSLKPDVILNELPLSLVDPNGRPIEKIRGKDNQGGPECWAADTVAMQLGIKQIPFDRPDRQENFKSTNYFERENRSNKLINKWSTKQNTDDPNCLDLKICGLGGYTSQSQDNFTMPETINSEGFDSVIKMKHFIWYEMMPQVLEKYKGYEETADDFRFFGKQWKERNSIMVNNIISAAKEHSGKRLVVITGSEHRYSLRDLLKDEPAIELKEYWEVIDQNAVKPTK